MLVLAMNEPISFCVKRLINEIQSRPVIWDSRIKEYSDRSLKKEAWDELCAAFVPCYHESSIGERNGIVALLQRKWKSVRDAFLRELKKTTKPQAGIKCTKPYAYFDNLMFLKPVCELRPRKEDDETSFQNTTYNNSDYEENEDSDSNVNNTVSNLNEHKPECSQPTRKRRRVEDTEETVLHMLADHMRTKKKRKAHDDPDRQFLLSLLPELKSMDPSVKFNLKYDIMSLIKRYKEEDFKFFATYTEK